MEDNTQHLLLALLKSGIWNEPLDSNENFQNTDWNMLYSIAKDQTVIGFVAEGMNSLPSDALPPQQILQRILSTVSHNRIAHARLNNTLIEIMSLLKADGIIPVLLKGQGLATNYKDPTLRTCGDIDLYIGKENYKKACMAAHKWGEDIGSESEESNKHYHFSHGDVPVELHRVAEILSNPWQNHRFQKWTELMLAKDRLSSVNICDYDVSVPPADFNALYIFNHAYHHFLSMGIGLRQLCDWIVFLHKNYKQIDRDSLEKNLKAFGLWNGWLVFGSIAVDYLGLPETEYPFYNKKYNSKAGKALQLIFEGGNFGFHNKNMKNRPNKFIQKKLHSFRWKSIRFIRMAMLFPKQSIEAWIGFVFDGIHRTVTGV